MPYSRFTFQKFLKCLTRKQHRIIPPHHLDRYLAPQKVNPAIRKLFALLRLHRLDRARVAFQKNARVILARLESQSASILAQSRVSLNKIRLAHPEKFGDLADFKISEPHLPWPAATGSASLTWQVDFHEQLFQNSRTVFAEQYCRESSLVPTHIFCSSLFVPCLNHILTC